MNPRNPHLSSSTSSVISEEASELGNYLPLSFKKQGFVLAFTDVQGEDQNETYKQREFEKRFFADATNQLFCKTFLENAFRDPISREVGKLS